MHEIPKVDTLELAESLPAWMYRDPAVLVLEHERIFERTWQWFCRSDQVTRPGDFVAGKVGREPVVVVRGRDDHLRALSNVCRHRAGPVAAGEGNARYLRCGYHGWTYALDGGLGHTPEFAGVECFDRAEHCLPAYTADEWQGHVFVNLDRECEPLREYLGPLDRWAAHYRLSDLRFDFRQTYELACNWKAYVDNSQEGYHIPSVHPMLALEIDMHSYREEREGMCTRQVAPPRPTARGVELFRLMSPARRGLDAEEATASQFINLFPNWVINLHPDHVVTELLEPVDVGSTRIHLDYWFPATASPPRPRLRRAVRGLIGRGITDAVADEAENDANGVVAGVARRVAGMKWWQTQIGNEITKALNIHYTHLTQLEDCAIVARVQDGLGAPSYEQGRLSVRREAGVHHFQALVAAFLRGER